MNAPTPEQIAKLPKWAREHLSLLEGKLRVAERTADGYVNNQTPSPFFIDDWMAKDRTRRYIQSPTSELTVEHAGVHLRIFLARPDDGQRPFGIELGLCEIVKGQPRWTGGTVAVVPHSFNKLFLMHKDNLK